MVPPGRCRRLLPAGGPGRPVSPTTVEIVTTLIAVVAVLVVALVLAVVGERRGARRLAHERTQADEQLQALQSVVDGLEEQADALRRKISHDDETRKTQAAVLWELYRVRCEREWGEIAGTTTELPVPWDGTCTAAIAVEVEAIREGIGTPGRLTTEGSGVQGAGDPLTAMIVTFLAGELLRRLARIGEELVVQVTPAGVDVLVAGGPAPMSSAGRVHTDSVPDEDGPEEPGAESSSPGGPAVDMLARLAIKAGGHLELRAEGDGIRAVLAVTPPASS